jgi:Sulfotransferase family
MNRNENGAEPRPLFIFGCPRSGTSLLSRMLDAHPRIAIPYESHLYNEIYPLVQHRGDLGDLAVRARLVDMILRTEYLKFWTPRPSAAETIAAIRRPGFHGIFEALLRAWTARRGKARWGEKTPQHALCWRTLVEGFPDLQIIHLVRDGRDVALSYRAAHFGPKHVYHLAQRWARYVKAAEEAGVALGDRAFLMVRYEDLITAPEPELRRICAFLGEEFTPAMLSYYRGDTPYPTDDRNSENLRRPVLSDNAGKWRTAMSPREIRIFEALAGAELERYGYPRTVEHPHIGTWEALSCRYLEHPPRRALAVLKNRQGQRSALQRLRFSLLGRMGL